MKRNYLFGILIFSILGIVSINQVFAINGTDMGMTNSSMVSPNNNPNVFCSTGVMNAQGLCSQPTMGSQNVISQGGTIPNTSAQSSPNTYWCRPGTTDSNLCWMKTQGSNSSINSQGGILSQSNLMSNGNSQGNLAMSNGNSQGMSNQFNTLQGINSNLGGTISPNSLLGLFTNANAVCSPGMMMESQGLCVNSQGVRSYYSAANCNFGIDPATNQCLRTMNSAPSMFSQGGILSQSVQNAPMMNTQNMSANNISGMNSTGQSMNSQMMNSQNMASPGMMSSQGMNSNSQNMASPGITAPNYSQMTR